MNLEHVVKINGRVHVIERATDVALLLNSGRDFAVAYLERKKLVHKHCLSGRFMCVKIKD